MKRPPSAGMMRRSVLLLIAVGCALLAAPSALAAQPATWEGPADGATVPRSWAGPATYRVHEAGELRFTVTGPGGYAWETTTTTTEDDIDSVLELTGFPPFSAPGSYTASVARGPDGTEPDERTWNVARVNEATILSPASGLTRLGGYRGPVVVGWDEPDPTGRYSVRLDGTPACTYDGTLTDGEQTSCTLPPLGAGTHVIRAYDETAGEVLDAISITILRNLVVSSRSASPLVFYPLVRDGYRDTTRFRFVLNQRARVVVRVKNASGRVVRRVSLGRLSSGSWRWNGRDNSGRKVKPGYYRIYLTASNALQTRRSSPVRVRVKTALVTRYGRRSYLGCCGPGTVQWAGDLCQGVFDWLYEGDLFLDCWGGGWIRSNYLFRIPASTFRTNWSVRGRQYCCYTGPFSKTGTRLSRTRYRVRVQIGGWRSFDIRRVTLNWAYKKRI